MAKQIEAPQESKAGELIPMKPEKESKEKIPNDVRERLRVRCKDIDLVDLLSSKREPLNKHLHRILDHLINLPTSPKCKVSITVELVVEEKSIEIECNTKSVIPDEKKYGFSMGKINMQDAEVELFD